MPSLRHLYQYDPDLHERAKRHAEINAALPDELMPETSTIKTLAQAYLDLLEKRGLPPKLKCYPSIQLATGEYFDFLDPDSTPISPEAMASSLSKVARCNGHTTGELAVSVAQHCVLSALAAPEGFKFEALMHDAAECVTGDITTPLKQLLGDFKRIEKNIEHSIRSTYLLPLDMTKTAKDIDLRMAATEKRDVMPKDTDGEWESIRGILPLHGIRIDPWHPTIAKDFWLKLFNKLWPQHQAWVQKRADTLLCMPRTEVRPEDDARLDELRDHFFATYFTDRPLAAMGAH